VMLACAQRESSQSPFGRRSAWRSRTLYRRPREYPDYLAMELVNDDELQLRMEALCWVYNQAAAHRTARVCREDLTVDGLHFAPEVMSWPLLPRSRNT
jgi:hypothetical protein